jgi:hypothetical protein
MSEVTTRLREGFEAAGFAVDDASENRDELRVTLQETTPDASALRGVVEDVLGEEHVLGVDVTSEATADDQAVGTVVSVRHRP